MKVSRIVRDVVYLFIVVVFSSLLASAQSEIKPEDCSKSKENLRACFGKFTSQLNSMKTNSADKVKILKRRLEKNPDVNERKKLVPLKDSYEDARKNVNDTLSLLKKREPDFTNIKQQFDTAVEKFRRFTTEANTALTGSGPTAFGFFDFILDFGCQFLNLPKELCDEVKDLVKNLQINTLKWKKWDDIRG